MPLEVSSIKTKIPTNFFPLVIHLNQEEILAEKIRAFLIRAKGRDIFDFWHLLDRDIAINEKILTAKLKRAKRIFDKKELLEKIKQYPSKKLEQDLAKFLPRSYRKIIPLLKEKIGRIYAL